METASTSARITLEQAIVSGIRGLIEETRITRIPKLLILGNFGLGTANATRLFAPCHHPIAATVPEDKITEVTPAVAGPLLSSHRVSLAFPVLTYPRPR